MQENLSKKETSTEKGESEDIRYSKNVDKTDDNDYDKDRGEQDGRYGKTRSDEIYGRGNRDGEVEGLDEVVWHKKTRTININ